MTIALQKAHETAGIHLQKHGIDAAALPAMRVALCLDTSGSMSREYHDGHVQKAVTHLLALAMHMDKSHRLDVFTFDHRASQCRYPATPENYEDYVQAHILGDGGVHKWGSTSYAPPLHLLYQHYFQDLTHLHSPESAADHVQRLAHHGGGLLGGLFHRRHETPPPAPVQVDATGRQPLLVLFLTDGDNEDKPETRQAVHAANGLPIFFSFVGLAHDSRFLEELSRETDAEFVHLEDGIRIDDTQLYAQLVSPKLVTWLRTL